jgi:hypothetical protein
MKAQRYRLARDTFSLVCGLGAGCTVWYRLYPEVRYISYAATDDVWLAYLYALSGLCAGIVCGIISGRRWCPLLLWLVTLPTLIVHVGHMYFASLEYETRPLRDTVAPIILECASGDGPHVAVLGVLLCAAFGTVLGSAPYRRKEPPKPPDDKILI